MFGDWIVCADRFKTAPLGRLLDGVGIETNPGDVLYSIKGDHLFSPSDEDLGELKSLGDSWATDLGGGRSGHILRRSREAYPPQ